MGMTDRELRDAAVRALKATTISYPRWESRVEAGYYPRPEDTQWGKAFALLDEIGLEAPVLPEPPATNTLLGVYVGAGKTTLANDFAAWVGDLDFVVDWTDGNPDNPNKWADIENPWTASVWDGKYRLHLSVNPWPDSGGSLAQGASGAYDSHYAKLAESLRARGMVDTIIRFGWEFPGHWYPWGVKTTADAANFAAMFRKASAAMKAVCPTLKMDWNGIITPSIDPALAYPGDPYVDYITFDHYDTDWVTGGMTPTEAWNHWRRGLKWGINWWIAFAQTHGKPWGVPEWGLVHAADQEGHGNGDNPAFIDQMADLFSEPGCGYQAYFNFDAPDGRHKLGAQFPQGTARFKARFG
jgi:hypothetical protein